MGRLEKAKERLKAIPKDYTYSEVRTLLCRIGFEEFNKGKTSGSRVKFYRKKDGIIIMLHKPHPGDVMSVASTRDVYEQLHRIGEI